MTMNVMGSNHLGDNWSMSLTNLWSKEDQKAVYFVTNAMCLSQEEVEENWIKSKYI